MCGEPGGARPAFAGGRPEAAIVTEKETLGKHSGYSAAWLAAALLLLQGCHDLGSTLPPTLPQIAAVEPAEAAPGDTITIVGSYFGPTEDANVVRIGGIVADTIISWSESEIRVRIPARSANGQVDVSVSGYISNTVAFQLKVPQVPVSFATDILPIFVQHGCYECHGGSGGLVVHTVADLLRGGQDGPAIVPGNSAASLLIKKVSPNPPFGDRMPQGGPYLDSATVAVIAAWITQGAQDN